MKANSYNVYNKDNYGDASACKVHKGFLYSHLGIVSKDQNSTNSIFP